MTTLNLNSFLDGNAADATALSENFYDPNSSPVATSLEVINGWLDSGNVENTWTMDTYHLQPHCLTEGRMVGATLNHDYFSDSFFKRFNAYEEVGNDLVWVGKEGNIGAGFTPAQDEPTAEHSFFTAIPGAGITFYVPFPVAFIVFTWSIRWTHDGEAIMDLDSDPPVALDEERAAIRLFVQTPQSEQSLPPGTGYADNYRRVIGQVNVRPLPVQGLVDIPVARFDYSRHREWSGHYVLGASGTNNVGGELDFFVPSANAGISPGWYSASLRIASSAKQARVQVRSMRYACFKLEETTLL